MSLCVPHTPLIRGYRKQEDKRQRARRLRRLDNRGIEVSYLVIAIVGILVAGLIAALVFYLFYGAKTKLSGFGSVLASATGDASTGIVSITIQNELNVPIDVQKITIYSSNGKTITLSSCQPSETPKVPAGSSVTIVCKASGLVGGYTYTVVITYKTPNGHTAAVQTSFTPT